MKDISHLRIAWLLPTMRHGFYWQSLFSEFAKLFPETVIFTGLWPGFAAGFEGAFMVKMLRKTRFIETTRTSVGYSRALISASPGIIRHLLCLNPHAIFTNAFSIWTLFALLLKPYGKWRVLIAYEGSSPNTDCRDSIIRSACRRAMVRFADAFITNSQAGKVYLTEVLEAEESRVFVRPYEVPTSKALLRHPRDAKVIYSQLQHPVFLYVGQVIPRKGLRCLLDACSVLCSQGYRNYALLVVGDGPQRQELEIYSESHGLKDYIKWMGWIDYSHLGDYFRNADVFVFPTLEDTWGVVVLESLLFGKPVLCSKWAGAAEMVVDGENGYVFDPYQSDKLAELMRRFIEDPDLPLTMGEKAGQRIAAHTPEAAAAFLRDVVRFVFERNGRRVSSDVFYKENDVR